MNHPDVNTTVTPILAVERALLRAAELGDQSAFEKLVVPHRGRIFGIAKRIVRNHEDAEDVVQVSLLQAFRHLDAFEGHSRFSTWLTHIVINESLMLLRSNARKQAISLDQLTATDSDWPKVQVADNRPTPEQHYAAEERRAVLTRLIDKLRPAAKQCLKMRLIHELSLKDSARLLGLSVPTVKSRLHHARRALTRTAARKFASRVIGDAETINANHSHVRQ